MDIKQMSIEELVEEFNELIEVELLQNWDMRQEGPDAAVLSFEHSYRKEAIEKELIERGYFVA
jgi:hypothetical protein